MNQTLEAELRGLARHWLKKAGDYEATAAAEGVSHIFAMSALERAGVFKECANRLEWMLDQSTKPTP